MKSGNTVRAHLERRASADAGTSIRTRVCHHHSPLMRACARVRLRSGHASDQSWQSSNGNDPGPAELIRYKSDPLHRRSDVDRAQFRNRATICLSFCRPKPSFVRATDSHSHPPMSVEPFLVTDHARPMSLHGFQDTRGDRPRNFVLLSGCIKRTEWRWHGAANFLPLARQGVDESSRITEAGWLR